ncbi:hypothetical protein NPIL_45801 [Nephila pilipes]|uniref:Granulins domain-containing protein n=1 Tax=Nephila pilipes TaxID=299642 RepID=A0A8X6R5I9_NEPPI|nr:hypothetical protein NPIL_45801 [Nephila pilipes]
MGFTDGLVISSDSKSVTNTSKSDKMRKLVLSLLISVFITGIVAEVCDDGTDCGSKVCCKSWFHYRCCPIENGVCCSGGNHCCPKNQECLQMGINNFCASEKFMLSPGNNSERSVSVRPSVLTERSGSSSITK